MAPRKKAKKSVAKARTPRVKAAEAEQEVQPSEVMKMPSVRKLRELARHVQNSKATIAELSGRSGSAIRTMADNDGLHPKAFRHALAESREDPGKLNDFLAHRRFYEEALGVFARAESAPRLPLEETDGEPEAEAAEGAEGAEGETLEQAADEGSDEGSDEGNVTQFPAAAAE